MKVWITGLLVVFVAATAHAADPLAEARRLYNLGQYDNAAKLARDAIKVPAMAEGARLILGRIYLEQYRSSERGRPDAGARSAYAREHAVAGSP